MSDDRINAQASALPEDGSVLGQVEAGPPSYEELYHMPTASGYQTMTMVPHPPYRVSTQQETPEMATLTNIRNHTRRLTQQLDDHILRCESRNQGNPSRAAAGSNAEATNGNICQEEARIIEAAERDRLVELALVIHGMLYSLHSHSSGPMDHTSSFILNEIQEDPRYIQATRHLESSPQDLERILAEMDPSRVTADRGDDEPHGGSRRRQRLGGNALSRRLSRWSGF